MINSPLRFSFLFLAVYLLTVVTAKPYVAELSIRQNYAAKREVGASRPHSPELFTKRVHDESIDIVKRSTLNFLETRKTNTCTEQSQCDKGEYCDTNNKKCASQKKTGSSCSGNNYECDSKYCSNKSKTCRVKGQEGDSCLVDAGCDSGLDCINQVCTKLSNNSTTTTFTETKSSTHHSSKSNHSSTMSSSKATHTSTKSSSKGHHDKSSSTARSSKTSSPSGSPKHKRLLRFVE